MYVRTLMLFAGLLVWQPAPAQDYVTENAERFVALLAEYSDEITHEAIQTEYLKPGTRGIKTFKPNRIQNARHMADMGYWIGKRICAAYYAQAGDKHEALQVLLHLKDPEEILAKSGCNPV